MILYGIFLMTHPKWLKRTSLNLCVCPYLGSFPSATSKDQMATWRFTTLKTLETYMKLMVGRSPFWPRNTKIPMSRLDFRRGRDARDRLERKRNIWPISRGRRAKLRLFEDFTIKNDWPRSWSNSVFYSVWNIREFTDIRKTFQIKISVFANVKDRKR